MGSELRTGAEDSQTPVPNRSKGDRDPSEWLPTTESFQCDYVARWIMTKARWALGSDEPERDACNIPK